MSTFWNGFEKQAEDPSWWQKQKGAYRAMRASDKGVGQAIVDPKLIKERLKKSLTHGGTGLAGGAGLGAVAGALSKRRGGAPAGALIGGLLGQAVGGMHGQYQADKKYLGQKGIRPKYLGMSADFTPAARKKYIDKYEKKK